MGCATLELTCKIRETNGVAGLICYNDARMQNDLNCLLSPAVNKVAPYVVSVEICEATNLARAALVPSQWPYEKAQHGKQQHRLREGTAVGAMRC